MSDDHGPHDGRDDPQRRPEAPRPAKLLHLADYESPRPERIARELQDYWQSLRTGRAVPARSQVEPREIRRALDYAFILERIGPGSARFRLAGRHLIDVMGMEVRGMPLCSVINPGARGRFADLLESVFHAPQIARLQLEGPASYGRPAMTGLLLLLPLRSDLGDVTRALGCLVTQGGIGQTPRRFDLRAEDLIPLIPGARIIEPASQPQGPDPVPAQPSPIEDAPSPQERRARFKVISNDPPPSTDRRM